MCNPVFSTLLPLMLESKAPWFSAAPWFSVNLCMFYEFTDVSPAQVRAAQPACWEGCSWTQHDGSFWILLHSLGPTLSLLQSLQQLSTSGSLRPPNLVLFKVVLAHLASLNHCVILKSACYFLKHMLESCWVVPFNPKIGLWRASISVTFVWLVCMAICPLG